MLIWDEMKKEFLAQLEQALLAELDRIRATDILGERLLYHFRTGGKRLRALCVPWAHYSHAVGKNSAVTFAESWEKCLPFAVAVEILHNATLIHDDIQDGDTMRRGQATLWKKYSVAQAINSGDYLFFMALAMIGQAPQYVEPVKTQLYILVQRNLLAVISGQESEFVFKENFAANLCLPQISDYEAMVAGKTAALFVLPLLGGAHIAQASDAELAALGAGARSLGLAFQIQDDWVDLWGTKGREQIGSDIAEGKLSYPAILGVNLLENAGRKKDVERLLKILAAPRENTSSTEITWAIQILEQSGAREQSRARVLQLGEAAIRESGPWCDCLTAIFQEFSRTL